MHDYNSDKNPFDAPSVGQSEQTNHDGDPFRNYPDPNAGVNEDTVPDVRVINEPAAPAALATPTSSEQGKLEKRNGTKPADGKVKEPIKVDTQLTDPNKIEEGQTKQTLQENQISPHAENESRGSIPQPANPSSRNASGNTHSIQDSLV